VPEKNWPGFRLFEKVFFSELARLLFCSLLFVIIIIIIIIIIIMVVGWWCNAGVTRKREDPHNLFGGWWGQPANRNETGHNKTTGASRGFGLPHALPPEHKLNKLTSTRSGLPQRSQHSARRGGWAGKRCSCLAAWVTEVVLTNSDCLLCPLTLQAATATAIATATTTTTTTATMTTTKTTTAAAAAATTTTTTNIHLTTMR
jgi:hypothetical protein